MFNLTRDKFINPPSWMIIFQRSMNHLFFLSCFHPGHGDDRIEEFLNCFTKENFKCKQIVCAGDGYGAGGSADHNRSRESDNVVRISNFFDVNISFDPVTLNFESKPNLKYFQISSFPFCTSNHPKKEFNNTLMLEFHRLKSLSSSNEIYQESSRILTSKILPPAYRRLNCFGAQKRVNEQQALCAFPQVWHFL